MDGAKPARQADVVLGEDWIGPDATVETELRAKRERRGLISINRSPLARKIITFNLLAILVLVAGVLFLNPFRDSLVFQREQGLVIEAQLIAEVFEAKLPENAPVNLTAGDGMDVTSVLNELSLPSAVEVHVFGPGDALLGSSLSQDRPVNPLVSSFEREGRNTIITDFLNRVWESLSRVFMSSDAPVEADTLAQARSLAAEAGSGRTAVDTGTDPLGNTIFAVATPIMQSGTPVKSMI